MELANLAKYIDHTLLDPRATWEDIRNALDLAVRLGGATACVPLNYVKRSVDYLGRTVPVTTIVDYPFGYSSTAVKAFEAYEAAENGAGEVETVINIGWIKDERYSKTEQEIKEIRRAIGNIPFTVIVETGALTDREKIESARLASSAGADYIKTSTGFHTPGVRTDDILILAGNTSAGFKIKASGGICTLEQAIELLSLGADRICASRLLPILNEVLR